MTQRHVSWYLLFPCKFCLVNFVFLHPFCW
uniref:Uncharacterized protein n=1 Tax=Anguilla anguilla TaxID=7936 RepID=A0A0E9T620_ANGAN